MGRLTGKRGPVVALLHGPSSSVLRWLPGMAIDRFFGLTGGKTPYVIEWPLDFAALSSGGVGGYFHRVWWFEN